MRYCPPSSTTSLSDVPECTHSRSFYRAAGAPRVADGGEGEGRGVEGAEARETGTLRHPRPLEAPRDAGRERDSANCNVRAYTNGSSVVPVCASRKHRHYSGNRHYSAYYHCSLFPSVPSDFAGTIAGNRHYSTGTTAGPLLCDVQ